MDQAEKDPAAKDPAEKEMGELDLELYLEMDLELELLNRLHFRTLKELQQPTSQQ